MNLQQIHIKKEMLHLPIIIGNRLYVSIRCREWHSFELPIFSMIATSLHRILSPVSDLLILCIVRLLFSVTHFFQISFKKNVHSVLFILTY